MAKYAKLSLPTSTVAADVPAAVEDDGVEIVGDYAKAKLPWTNMLAAMDGGSGDLHAVHQRLAETKPFLKGAIRMAKGDAQSFLIELSEAL